MDNIGLLNDTLKIVEKGYYRKGIKKVSLSYSSKELRDAIVYLPKDVEVIRNNPTCNAPVKMGSRCQFGVSNSDSFSIVTDPYTQKFYTELRKDKTPFLVLNFANSVSPGGGVRRGARAQEEDLCRKSTLLLSLESNCAEPYYLYHRANNPYLASDAMILSPYVEIIRDENNDLLDEPIKVAVLTCAAPNLMMGNQGLTEKQLEDLLYQRIQGIIAMAASLNYNKLVLGAWGCGAFRNDANMVAKLFHKAFKTFQCGYRKASTLFDQVTFAVLDRSSELYNYNSFNNAFIDYYAEEDKATDNSVHELIRNKEEAYLDKIQGSLVGGAIGDALGYPVEFLSLDSIKQKYGASGITKYELDRQTGTAVISDDTQMTLFTATGLLVGDTRLSMRGIAGEPSSYVFLSYLNWMETQGVRIENPFRVSWLMDVEELYVRRAPGNTCLSALEGRTHKSEYATTKKPINNSKGCGGVMRVAPVGLFYNIPNIEKVNEIAAEIAAITHSHPLGYIPAAMLAHIVNRLIYGKCSKGDNLLYIIKESIDTANSLYKDIPEIAYMTDLVNKAVEYSTNNRSDAENIKALGEGWVAEEALAIAIYCTLKYQDDFTKAMIASVNHDGDSDSTGAITGNILGALIGYTAIPECWKNDLELKDIILEVATDLCRGCQMSEYGTYNDPKWASKYMQMKAYSN